MTSVSFYHLQGQALSLALPLLLEKVFSQGHQVLVRVRDETQMKLLDESFWTFKNNSFLPHANVLDENVAISKVVISDNQTDNPNAADILVLADDQDINDLEAFDRCLYMFEGQNDESLTKARQRWKSMKDQNIDLTYWQQTEQGWQKKA